MGDWDFYCFLCAAGFHIPYEIETGEDFDENDNDDEDDDQGQNVQEAPSLKKLFPREDVAKRLAWLSAFRTIGQNRNAPGLTQCFLSGPATEEDYGSASVESGTHPNAQNIDTFRNCYRDGEEETGDLPVHDSCFAILCKVFAKARGTDYQWRPDQASTTLPFDLDALFLSLADVRREYQSYLNLDHTFMPDQYFYVSWACIYNYFDPSHGLGINWPAIDPADTDDGQTHPTDGLLDTLPHELLTYILDLTTERDLISLMQASRSVHRVTKSNKFWQHRLQMDAPWFWESRECEDSTDTGWHECYNHVMIQALRPLYVARKDAYVSGLANRKRIWKVCEQVLQMYLKNNTLANQVEQKSIFENGVTCRYLPAVASRQKTPQYVADIAFFFNNQSEMNSAKRLELHWNDKGALCGVCLEVEAREVTFGESNPSSGKKSSLEIQPGDWIEKLILNISIVETWKTTRSNGTPSGVETTHTSLAITGIAVCLLSQATTVLGRDEGNKRLLEPLPGNGIVGLKCQSSHGTMTHLGILEHSGGMTKYRLANDSKRLDCLWADRLPSPDLRFKDYHTGYWTHSTPWDMAPMQALMFGSTDLEQATMTGLGASSSLRRFEVYRSDGSCEKVGSGEDPMKVFNIDGPGGERIAGYEVTIGALPVGLTMVTTSGRQAVFGKRADNARHGHTSEHGFGVAGLYCSFEYGSASLSSLGLIQSPHIDRQPMNDRRLEDGNGLLWEPRPPPPSWHATGTLHGPQHRGEVAVCIDFSRPVTRIDDLYPAPDWMNEIELGGFSISYGDNDTLDSSLRLGVSRPQWLSAINATSEQLRRVESLGGMAISGGKEVDTGTAHVKTDEEALEQPKSWDFGQKGEKIVAVTVWAGGYLHGLQFHAENGEDSPRWGKCGGEPSGKIHVGGEEKIVGLKFILGSKRLNITAPNLSPQAVQAMRDVAS